LQLLRTEEVEAIERDDEINDLREAMSESELRLNPDVASEAIPGIADNSITETIEVLLKVDEWVDALLDGRNHQGQLLKDEDDIDEHTKKLADHQNSDLYVARQLKFFNRVESCLEKRKNKNHGDENKEAEITKDSILLNVLAAIKPGRLSKQNELNGRYKDEDLVLNELSPKGL
jgi:hypothetical protein